MNAYEHTKYQNLLNETKAVLKVIFTEFGSYIRKGERIRINDISFQLKLKKANTKSYFSRMNETRVVINK